MSSLTRKFLTGLYWVNASSFLVSILRAILGIYLARNILPEIFGQHGLIDAAITLIWSFVTFGEVQAIFRQRENIEQYMRMQMAIRCSVIGFVIFVSSILYLIGWIPVDEELKGPIFALFTAGAFSSLTSIYHIYMERQMMFMHISLINASSFLVASSVAIYLLNNDYPLWSLISLLAVERTCHGLLVLIYTPARFKPRMNISLAKEFFSFGKYAFFSSLAERAFLQVDKIVVGSFVGTSSLAYYNRGLYVGGLFRQFLVNPILTLFGPALGSLREESDKKEEFFYLILKGFYIAALAGYGLLAVIIPELIVLLYGETWLPTVPVFRALIPALGFFVLEQLIVSAVMVEGHSKIVFGARFGGLLVFAALIYPLINLYGLIGAVWTLDVSVGVTLGVLIGNVSKAIRVSWLDVLIRPTLAVVISLSILLYVMNLPILDGLGSIVSLVSYIFTYGFFLIILIYSLDTKYCKRVLGLVFEQYLAARNE